MPGTNLHTSILPVYEFVLDFPNHCPRLGQNGIASEDRNQGRGQLGIPSLGSLRTLLDPHSCIKSFMTLIEAFLVSYEPQGN